jgi:hypothetical protein
VVLVLDGSQWLAGALPLYTFQLLHVVMAGLGVLLPALIGLFNRSAAAAVRAAAPLVLGGSERARELEASITRAPRLLSVLPAVLFLPIATVRILYSPGFADAMGLTLAWPAIAAELAFFPLVALSVSAYVVKIASLAWDVHRITTRELRVSIWTLEPLMQFSLLTARLAGSTVIVLMTVALIAPDLFRDQFGFIGLCGGLALALAVFALPLSGLHARIVAARQEVQGGIARQLQRALEDLRVAVEAGNRAEMDPINKAIGAIDVAQKAVDRVPTWPWSTETFRWVVGALMFPIVIFVSQAILRRVLP